MTSRMSRMKPSKGSQQTRCKTC